MTTSLGAPRAVPTEAAERAAEAAAGLLVHTVAIDDVGDLLARLPGPDPARTFSWVRRGEGVVGWGEALRISTAGPGRIRAADAAWTAAVGRLRVHDEVGLPGTGAVAFGSFAFSPASAAGGVLVLPEVVVGRREGRSWLTTVRRADAGPAARAGSEPPALPTPQPVTAPGQVTYRDGALSAEAWQAAVAEVVGRIRAGEVAKVVMARDVVARAAAPLDVRHLLGRLAADYPACWTFAVDHLVGATPELLVRREKGLAACRVLAGTIRRTGDDADDLRRAAELARSSKDLEEHELAVASLVKALRPYCASINVPDAPFVLHLPNVMHLASDVTGVVDGALGHPSTFPTHGAGGTGPSSLALAAALHPTAAVGGTPTREATAILAEAERMDRARYAGPVGWIGADGDGEWGIALRSGELSASDSHEVRLFAGCGVVAASDPAAELAESEAKLQPMRGALAGR
ncbi:isochorismate synthase [Georgenia thermotolerans]|uniref:isochorismate synthase n=1 Tax=Georgenia thermotolerans TaxID=527326 RepID=A0A7J5UKL8_9MICO|nr:isochorismate synthase [Georgenia thermotolerans]KAE8762932.1 isochorismate synthase [Georgenia thermotolerans]